VRVLSINVGSSSLKLALFELTASGERRLLAGKIDGLGSGDARLVLQDVGGGAPRAVLDEAVAAGDPGQGMMSLLDGLARSGFSDVDAVGHRLVHGGPDHVAPERVTDELLDALDEVVPFAPLHLPRELAAVRAIARRSPSLPQVVCFDTAFHRGMPAVARRLPLPRALWDEGVRRYGFHGLSYEYVVGAVAAARRGRVVVAHLGNGASLAAVRDGVPVDTTMGLTPTGGLMMGTRSGDLDPGVLLHLARVKGWDTAALQRLVEEESGLRGVSGGESDVRVLLERRATSAAAAEAVELFCWIARKHVGAMAAALGGLDRLIFTGGIGEHAAPVRAEICAGLGHLGVTLDDARNAANAAVVTAAGSACTVHVVATDEEVVLAHHTRDCVAPA